MRSAWLSRISYYYDATNYITVHPPFIHLQTKTFSTTMLDLLLFRSRNNVKNLQVPVSHSPFTYDLQKQAWHVTWKVGCSENTSKDRFFFYESSCFIHSCCCAFFEFSLWLVFFVSLLWGLPELCCCRIKFIVRKRSYEVVCEHINDEYEMWAVVQ